MVRISKYHRRPDRHERDEDGKKRYVKFDKVDRSKYPKPITWIIFSIAGAVLMWFIMQFFIKVFR